MYSHLQLYLRKWRCRLCNIRFIISRSICSVTILQIRSLSRGTTLGRVISRSPLIRFHFFSRLAWSKTVVYCVSVIPCGRKYNNKRPPVELIFRLFMSRFSVEDTGCSRYFVRAYTCWLIFRLRDFSIYFIIALAFVFANPGTPGELTIFVSWNFRRHSGKDLRRDTAGRRDSAWETHATLAAIHCCLEKAAQSARDRSFIRVALFHLARGFQFYGFHCTHFLYAIRAASKSLWSDIRRSDRWNVFDIFVIRF